PAPLQRAVAPLVGVAQVVLGVVQEAGVERLELKAGQGARELVGQELRVHAVPHALAVLHHLRERAALRFARAGQLEVGALHVADLADDDDLLTPQPSLADEVGHHLAHQPLAAAVGVVGGGIDEVAAGEQGPAQRLAVLGRLVVDAVSAEADAAARRSRPAERPVAGLARALAPRVGRGRFRGGGPGQASLAEWGRRAPGLARRLARGQRLSGLRRL